MEHLQIFQILTRHSPRVRLFVTMKLHWEIHYGKFRNPDLNSYIVRG